jgi:hypothetical protein
MEFYSELLSFGSLAHFFLLTTFWSTDFNCSFLDILVNYDFRQTYFF